MAAPSRRSARTRMLHWSGPAAPQQPHPPQKSSRRIWQKSKRWRQGAKYMRGRAKRRLWPGRLARLARQAPVETRAAAPGRAQARPRASSSTRR